MSDKNEKAMKELANLLFVKRDSMELAERGLAECLKLCGDLLLNAICTKNGMEPVEGPFHERKRASVRAELEQKIPALFEQKIPFLLPEQREQLDQTIQKEGQSVTSGNVERKDLALPDTLISLGAVYLCYTGDDAAFYMPVELQELYMGKKEQMKEIWQHHDQMWFYARALLNLYGTYDSGWYTQVWNQHNKNKITVQESEEYLVQISNLQRDGWFSEGFMVSSYMETPEELDGFLNTVADVPYYMPNKRDLLYYFDHQFDEDSVYWDKLLQLLTDWKQKTPECDTSMEMIMNIIGWACIMDMDESGILDQLEKTGVVFQTPETEKRFLALYEGMSMSTRKWALCGWRSMDMS